MRAFLRRRLMAWLRYNLLTFPAIAAIYVPYNVLWIGYTPLQLAKWLLTAAAFSAGANLAIQPWISYIYRRGWVEKPKKDVQTVVVVVKEDPSDPFPAPGVCDENS